MPINLMSGTDCPQADDEPHPHLHATQNLGEFGAQLAVRALRDWGVILDSNHDIREELKLTIGNAMVVAILAARRDPTWASGIEASFDANPRHRESVLATAAKLLELLPLNEFERAFQQAG